MRVTPIHGWMLGIAAVLGACFDPEYPSGNPCGPDGYCPGDLICHPQRNVCLPTIEDPDAGPPGADAGPDAGLAQDNADLQSLDLSVPGLMPVFASSTTEYELRVSPLVRSVRVTARPQHPDATMTIAGVENTTWNPAPSSDGPNQPFLPL